MPSWTMFTKTALKTSAVALVPLQALDISTPLKDQSGSGAIVTLFNLAGTYTFKVPYKNAIFGGRTSSAVVVVTIMQPLRLVRWNQMVVASLGHMPPIGRQG